MTRQDVSFEKLSYEAVVKQSKQGCQLLRLGWVVKGADQGGRAVVVVAEAAGNFNDFSDELQG